MTITNQVIDFLSNLEHDEFTIKDILLFNPSFKINTIRTIVSRDLVKRNIVVKKDGHSGKKDRIYIFQTDPKPKRVILRKKQKSDEEEEKQLPPELEESQESSYAKIGKGIEQLLQDKNHTNQNLEAKCKNLKRQLLDSEATVQDRDNHIVEQGKKIHELSEKVRKRSGGAIKLDELQGIVNGNTPPH
jgi:hypothetical protein